MYQNFDVPVSRKGTNCIKWDCAQDYFGGLPKDREMLPFWIADMDFRCPEPITQAICSRARHGIFGYTDYDETYRRIVSDWMAKRYGWTVGEDAIFFSPGIVPAISFLLEALTQVGDKVVIQPPVYYPFRNTVVHTGRVPLENPLVLEEGTYRMDLDGLRELVRRYHPKALILCSPHNPVGRVWSESELRQLGDICLSAGMLILSDEIHADIIRPGLTHVPIAKLFGNPENIITCTSPSKAFNMAGLYLSNIIINGDSVREKWLRETWNGTVSAGPIPFPSRQAPQRIQSAATGWPG